MATFPRYPDRFRNALMGPHHISVKAELWYNNARVGELPLVSGSVSADRNSAVRRTANVVIDPNALADPALGPRLNPYGSQVKLWRGIRYPDNTVDSTQVFVGRIDSMDKSLGGVSLRCSDLASTVVDCRFNAPRTLPAAQNINTVAQTLITECWASAPPTVLIDTVTDVLTRSGQTFEQERGGALDYLMKTIGSEWFADATGVFHLRALPAVVNSLTLPAWIVDSGDSGVLVSNNVGVDRQGVANYVVVDSEPVGGIVPAHGEWSDDDPASATYVNGPYGIVVAYFSGQAVNTTIAAENLAATLGANSIAKVEQVQVSCIPNPQLNLGDLVRVHSPRLQLDKMYFIQSFELPLDPDSAMTMSLFQTLAVASTTKTGRRRFVPSPLRVPEGCSWQPHL